MRRTYSTIKRLARYLTWSVLGFVAGAIALSIQGRGGPPLEPWHTEELSAEFTAGMADEIRTFEGYRRLEDRLFAQLEEEVYARTETGPEFALIRYSRGSAADPRDRERNWNRSFELAAPTPVAAARPTYLFFQMQAESTRSRPT